MLWACYILTAQRSATTLAGLDGLALAMAVGAVAVAPFSLAAAGPALFSPAVLAVGAAVAALSSLLPYALEAISLRRLPSSTFAVLMSLAPAVASATGAVLLGQRIDAIGALAIVCVVAASAGAVATSARRRHHDRQAPRPSAQSSSLQDHLAVSQWAAQGHNSTFRTPRCLSKIAIMPRRVCRGRPAGLARCARWMLSGCLPSSATPHEPRCSPSRRGRVWTSPPWRLPGRCSRPPAAVTATRCWCCRG
jgi:hypothetical protein